MKRRAFIGLIGASALTLPFLLTTHGLGPATRNNRIATANKVKMRVKLPPDAQKVIAQLGAKSKRVYLLAGPAIAAAAGRELPYLNLLIDTPKFSELKQSLYAFGVTPISTAELPGNFARFLYQDKSYNVVNMDFDVYSQLSASGPEGGLIVFAHSYLIYDLKDGVMLDPADALSAKSADGKSYLIKPTSQPKNLVHGFEHYLAATFDSTLLGLKPSLEYQQLEENVLNATPTEDESRQIMARVLNYGPDTLEVAGLDSLEHMLTSPVCLAAGEQDAGIDLSKVTANLRRLQQSGKEISSREFLGAVDAEFKKKKTGAGATAGLTEYLMASRNHFRRIGVLHEMFEQSIPTKTAWI